MNDVLFQEIEHRFQEYMKEVRRIGGFLRAPAVQHGQAQVPLLYSAHVLGDVNSQLAVALKEFMEFKPKHVMDEYMKEKKRRRKAQEIDA